MIITDKIKQYFGLLDDIVTDFLGDLKSLRYQLIIWAFAFNLYILKIIIDGKADYKLAIAGIGLLSLVYGMYFQSKHHEAEMNNACPAEKDDPKTERDPDADE